MTTSPMRTRLCLAPLCLAPLFAALLAAAPSVSQAADTDACAVGRRYIAAVQARDFETIVGLFAPDAEFSTPNGPVLHGPEIGTFYRTTVAALTNLHVEPRHFVGSARECYFEIWTKSKKNADGVWVPDADGEYIRGAIDHFTLNETGRVIQLIAFPAPTARMFK